MGTKVFGIDLGTTYSCISYLDETGNAVVLNNMEGNSTTPSVVFFESDTNVVVGEVAKDTAALFPDKVVAFIKRSIGKPGFTYNYNGENITPEEISAYILKKLTGDASKLLGEDIKDVVITCPAYFGINEKEATKNAGIIAGLNVLSIIDEPVAAAIAYGCKHSGENKTVLVYDLGGGTFDVTMIQITPNSINVVCTSGDSNLGGKNWDDSIISYAAEQFEAQTGVPADDLLSDMESLQDLTIKAEKAKKEISQKDKTMITINFNGNKARIELTRDTFIEITKHHLMKSIELTKELIEEAKAKNVTSFDELILVGGSTKMPQISEALISEFNITPNMFEPDQSVSKGASLYGNLVQYQKLLETKMEEIKNENPNLDINDPTLKDKAQKELVKDGFVPTLGGASGGFDTGSYEINPVTSKSFGIKANDENGVEKLYNIILKNTNVPCDITMPFKTVEANQSNVNLIIYEDENAEDVVDLSYGIELGNALLDLPSGLPAGAPIEVTFTLNREGLLTMKGVEKKEGRECHLTIEVANGISMEELLKATSRSTGISVS